MQTEDEFIQIIEQLYIAGMETEAEAVQIIFMKYMNQMIEDE